MWPITMRRQDGSDLAGPLWLSSRPHLKQVHVEHFTIFTRRKWTGCGCLWLRRAALTLSLESPPSFLRLPICHEVIGATL